MKKLMFLMGIALYALSPFFVYGQLLDPVDFKFTDVPDTVQAGEVFTVTVEASIDGKWHLYSVLNDPDAGPYPTQFSSLSSDAAIAGDVQESEAIIVFDPNFDTELRWHSHSAIFTIPVAFKSSVKGEQSLTLEVLYQVCDDRSCLPPKTKQVEQKVFLAGISDHPFSGFSEDPAGQKNIFGDIFSGGQGKDFLGILLLAIIAGCGVLFMPVVYPLSHLLVTDFLNHKEKLNRGVWKLSVGFSLFLLLLFLMIGGIASLLLWGTGLSDLIGSPRSYLIIRLLLIVISMSLMGLFEWRVHYRLTNWLNEKAKKGEGLQRIVFLMATFLSASFQCVAPLVCAIVLISVNGYWYYPVLGMGILSGTMALVFILMTQSKTFLKSEPKSSRWMKMVQVSVGFIVLVYAFRFIANG